MSTTYVAWNAKSYPWPPPEGWYLASDNQWWAPGTGPNPPPIKSEAAADGWADLSAATTERTTRVAARATTAASTSTSTSTPASATWPSLESAKSTADTAADAQTDTATAEEVVTPANQPATDNDAVATADAHIAADRQEVAADPLPETANDAIWQKPSQRPRRNRKTLVLVALGLLAIAGAIGTILAFATGGDTTAAESLSEVEESVTTTSTTATPPSTATTTAETSVEVVANSDQVAEYRARLEADGFSGEELTDADIEEFGSSFCVFALAAENAESFEDFRSEAIAENVGELSPDDLVLAIDDAVSVFCPEQATRLGIS